MTGKRILIIDDEKWVCSLLGDYLGDSGYVIDSAGSIAEAKIKLSKEPLPDLVLSDVMLQDGNGLFYLKEVRGQARTKNLPIIIMSAVRAHSKDKVTGLEFGADDYVSKPFELKEIKLRIDNVLRRYTSSPEIVLPAAPPVPSPRPVDSSDQRHSIESTLSHILKPSAPLKENSFSEFSIEKNQKQMEPIVEIPLKTEILDLIFNPLEFFNRWDDDSSWSFSLGIILLNGILWGTQNGIQDKSVGTGVISIISFFVGFIGLVSLLAWLIQWGFGLRNNPIPFRKTFGILGISLIPIALSAFMGVIYCAVSGGHLAEFTTGPLLVFPMLAAKSTIGFVLKRMDLFEIWSVALIGFGIARVIHLKVKKTMVIVGLCWVFLIAIIAILRGLI